MVEKSTTTRKRAQAKPTGTATPEKRARLGGTSNSSTALPSTRLSTSTTVNTTTTPRPRGRPPKNTNATTSNDNTPPRPRGRPPKNTNATSVTTSSSTNKPTLAATEPRSTIASTKSRQEQVRAQEMGIVRPTSKIMRRPVPKEQVSTTSSATATTKGTKSNTSTARASTSTTTKRTSNTASRVTKQAPPPPVLPIIKSSYRLQYVMQGHVEQDARTERANLWGCEYEPGTNVVAICGGDMILFLDVQQGRYVKKYSHVESNEEFKCLAWTLLKGSRDLRDDEAEEDDKCTVLAAAGRLGSIKLVNALQNQCFRHLFGHSKQIRKLQFSKAHPRWLFSKLVSIMINLILISIFRCI